MNIVGRSRKQEVDDGGDSGKKNTSGGARRIAER